MITLKTLPEASAQEVYNQVKEHLLKQMKKSEDKVTCLYRGPNNLKCAAGALISDEEYHPTMDRVGTWDDLVEEGLVPAAHQELIYSLQEVHDYYQPPFWEQGLQEVAKEYNLVP